MGCWSNMCHPTLDIMEVYKLDESKLTQNMDNSPLPQLRNILDNERGCENDIKVGSLEWDGGLGVELSENRVYLITGQQQKQHKVSSLIFDILSLYMPFLCLHCLYSEH